LPRRDREIREGVAEMGKQSNLRQAQAKAEKLVEGREVDLRIGLCAGLVRT